MESTCFCVAVERGAHDSRSRQMRNSLTHKDFIQRPQKTVSGAFFTISLLSSSTSSRFSCVASKKLSLKAVERNRAKRRTRAIATAVLKGRPGAFVIIIKRAALEGAREALRADLEKLVERVRAR
jgi:ribonuclease P protein component